jgi:phosphate transport system protein
MSPADSVEPPPRQATLIAGTFNVFQGTIMSEHIFKRFDKRLEKLLATLLKAGSLAQDQLETVIRALETGNEELAGVVIERDEKIDTYDLKIDKQCLNLLALQQPVASDLRVIMSALSINRNIERIGDHAVNIAERIGGLAPHRNLLWETTLLEMGKKTESMVVNALDAFLNQDPDLARTVIGLDDQVDELHHRNQSGIIELMKAEPDNIPAGAAMISICRDLERIADEATNIAEEVVFALEAEIIRHQQPETETGEPEAPEELP